MVFNELSILLLLSIVLLIYSIYISYGRAQIGKLIKFYGVLSTIILGLMVLFTEVYQKGIFFMFGFMFVALYIVPILQIVFISTVYRKPKSNYSNFYSIVKSVSFDIYRFLKRELTLDYKIETTNEDVQEANINIESDLSQMVENTFKQLNDCIYENILVTTTQYSINEVKFSIDINDLSYKAYVEKAHSLLNQIKVKKMEIIESEITRNAFEKRFKSSLHQNISHPNLSYSEIFKKPSFIQIMQKAVSPLYFPISLFFILSRYLEFESLAIAGILKHISMGCLMALVFHLFVSTYIKSQIEIEKLQDDKKTKVKNQIINKLNPIKSLLLN